MSDPWNGKYNWTSFETFLRAISDVIVGFYESRSVWNNRGGFWTTSGLFKWDWKPARYN